MKQKVRLKRYSFQFYSSLIQLLCSLGAKCRHRLSFMPSLYATDLKQIGFNCFLCNKDIYAHNCSLRF